MSSSESGVTKAETSAMCTHIRLPSIEIASSGSWLPTSSIAHAFKWVKSWRTNPSGSALGVGMSKVGLLSVAPIRLGQGL